MTEKFVTVCKIFGTFNTKVETRDRNGKSFNKNVRTPIRPVEIITRLASLRNNVQGVGNGGIKLVAETNHIDMFCKIYMMLKKVNPTLSMSFAEMTRPALDDRAEYNYIEVSCLLPDIFVIPTIESILNLTE